jgi:hypothetical protein
MPPQQHIVQHVRQPRVLAMCIPYPVSAHAPLCQCPRQCFTLVQGRPAVTYLVQPLGLILHTTGWHPCCPV